MPTLHGLPGTNGPIEAVRASSVTGFLNALRTSEAVTTAREEGAINVWLADGLYRCERYRFRTTVNSRAFTSKRKVAAWLREQLPQIEKGRQ